MNKSVKPFDASESSPSAIWDQMPAEGKPSLTDQLFPGCKVDMIKEFTQGRSPTTVTLYHLSDGTLPAVVKSGPRWIIEQEKKIYEAFIKNRRYHAIPLYEERLVYNAAGDQAAIAYQLGGGHRHDVVTLDEFLRKPRSKQAGPQADINIITNIFNKTQSDFWSNHTCERSISLRSIYDLMLPENLRIKARDIDADADLMELTPGNIDEALKTGIRPEQSVHLKDFVITEIRPGNKQQPPVVTLNLPDEQARRAIPQSRRVRIEIPPDQVMKYEMIFGLTRTHTNTPAAIIGRITKGTVIATRRDLFQQTVEAIPQLSTIKLSESYFSFEIYSQPYTCPNLFNILERLLNQRKDLYMGITHGDFQTGNILVSRTTGEFYGYIDFASTRYDHILKDIIRLEVSILWNVMTGPARVQDIVQFYQTLDQNPAEMEIDHALPGGLAIWQVRQQPWKRYVVADDEQEAKLEYYQFLFISLLSALTRDWLNARQKLVTVVVAAKVAELANWFEETLSPPS